MSNAVAPALDVEDSEPKLEKVASGANTVVRRWYHPALGPVYLRAWPWDPRRRPALQHCKAGDALREAGLQTPEVLHSEDSFSTMRRWGLESAVETAAPGLPYDPRDLTQHELLPEIGRQIALMHNVRSAEWGRPWLANDRPVHPREYWHAQIAKYRRRITPQTCGLPVHRLKRGFDQISKAAGDLSIDWPVLIHGDITPAHIYVSGKGELTWIDFGTVEFGSAEYDLAMARATLCDAQGFKTFIKAYQSASRGGRSIDSEAIKTYTKLIWWERLNSRIQRVRHRRERIGDQAAANDPKIKGLVKSQHKVEEVIQKLIG